MEFILSIKTDDLKHPFYDFQGYKSLTSKPNGFSMSGKNAKQLLIVLQKDDFTKVNEQLLEKVLASIGFKRDEDCLSILIEKPYEINLIDIIKANEIEKIISFGIAYNKLGYSIKEEKFQCFRLNNRIYLLSSLLSELISNQMAKRALWSSLKENYLEHE